MHKYVGRIVEIIYIDRFSRITQRIVSVRRVSAQTVLVFDVEKRAVRLLRLENILAMRPVKQRAV